MLVGRVWGWDRVTREEGMSGSTPLCPPFPPSPFFSFFLGGWGDPVKGTQVELYEVLAGLVTPLRQTVDKPGGSRFGAAVAGHRVFVDLR